MHLFPDVRSQRFSLGFVLSLIMAATLLASPLMAPYANVTGGDFLNAK